MFWSSGDSQTTRLKSSQGYTHYELNMSHAGIELGWGGLQHFSHCYLLYYTDGNFLSSN